MLCLAAVYRRVTDLFFAVRDGMLYCAFEGLDSAYLPMRSLCEAIVEDTVRPGVTDASAAIFLPETVYAKPEECAGEEWDFEVEPQLRESRRWIERELTHLGEPKVAMGQLSLPQFMTC